MFKVQKNKSNLFIISFLSFFALNACSRSSDAESAHEKYGVSYNFSKDTKCAEVDSYSDLELSEGYAVNCLVWQDESFFGIFDGDPSDKAKFIWKKLAKESQEARLGLAMIEIKQNSPSDFYYKSTGAEAALKTMIDAAGNESSWRRVRLP